MVESLLSSQAVITVSTTDNAKTIFPVSYTHLGFPSCHAANTFGLAFFLFYLFRNRALNWFIMLWAVVTCYSRSYLGVHYPGDLLVGAFVGFVGASLCYWLFSRLCKYRRKESYEHIYVPIWVGGITISGILAYIASYKLHFSYTLYIIG